MARTGIDKRWHYATVAAELANLDGVHSMTKHIDPELYFEDMKTKPRKGDRLRYNRQDNTLIFFRRDDDDVWVQLRTRNKNTVVEVNKKHTDKPPLYIVFIYTRRGAKRLEKLEANERPKLRKAVRWYKLRKRTD